MSLPDPKTRREVYLNGIASGSSVDLTPHTREEVYLDAIANNGGGGGGGTTVVANPELAGTEADLTGLQVGDTKYKVPSGGGGGALVVTDNSDTLNKTWKEIYDAAPLAWLTDGEGGFNLLNSVFEDDGDYFANFVIPQPSMNIIATYVASSADGYPVRSI